MKKISFIIVLFVFFSGYTKAQFNLGAELRPRVEYRDGYKRLPDTNSIAAYLITQRTRLNFSYSHSWFSTKISLQDVRVWGDEPLKKEVAGISLYEAWAEFKLVDSLFIKAGRQELLYDNERLFSPSSWSQKGISHDAAVLKLRKSGWSLDFGAAFNQYRDTTFTTDYSALRDNYKTLNFLWLTKKWEHLKFSLMGVADGYQAKNTINTTYLRATYGGMFGFNTQGFSSELRGYYQSGQDDKGVFINAYYASADFFYKIKDFINLQLGGEYSSGKNYCDSTNKQVTYFTNLYGSSHKFNGSMDYFTKPADEKYSGLVDIYLFVTGKISKKASVRCDVHYFALQNNFVENNEVVKKYLGTEIDLSSKVDFSKEVSLSFGYSVMFPGNTLTVVQSGNTDHFSNWGWLMLTFKPNFLKTESK
jgi:hypothetical protein